MSPLARFIVTALLSSGLFITGVLLARNTHQQPLTVAGNTFTPAQIPQTTLSGAGVTSSQNTIPLTALTTADGRAVTMAMLGSIGYGTLEPNTTSKEEIISFSGVTQNANGTAILTGVTRGLDFVSPYASTASLMKNHFGGAYFIISNTAPFYGQQFLFANNVSTSTGGIVFSSTTPPHYDFNPIFASSASTTLASKGYVDSGLAAGASPGTTGTAGIFLLSTALQAASSTATGVFNAITYNRVLASSYATDTPQTCNSASGGCVVMTEFGKNTIKQAFLDLTAAFTWAGTNIFNGAVSIAASASNKLTLNSIAYNFPSSSHASSTVLTEDGSGDVKWITPQTTVLNATGTVATISGTTASTTVETVVIPGGTLSNATMMQIHALVSQNTNAAFFEVDIGSGSATTAISNNSANSGEMNCRVYVSGASSEQAYCIADSTAGTSITVASTQPSLSTANPIYVAFIARPSQSGSGTASYNGTSIILNRQ